MLFELINVDKEGNVFLQDNSIALMPKMWAVYKDKYMGSNMVKWIVAMYDYKSPYRRLPEDERSNQVTFMIFEKESNSKTNHEKVIEAIDEYQRLQYDPLIDQYNAMGEQMFKMSKVYKDIEPTKDNLEDLNKIQTEMGKAALSRDKIKKLIMEDEKSDTKISGTGSEDFSLFEQEQRLEKGY